jgi:hypothetical protein
MAETVTIGGWTRSSLGRLGKHLSVRLPAAPRHCLAEANRMSILPTLDRRPASRILLLGLALWCAGAGLVSGQESSPNEGDVEFFQQKVEPILAAKCWKCHGPEKNRGGLRLDHRTFVLRGGDLGPAVELDAPEESQLLRAISYEDLEMPPDGRLPEDQIAVLTEWVARGLPWTPGDPPAADDSADDSEAAATSAEPHWAYQPIQRTAPPDVANSAWSANPIDRFVQARLEAHQLPPNPPASPQVLIRRLHYDLLGLPPSPEEVEAFAADADPLAYERLADRLLSRPQFGEKWGRHWLDLVRFAETNGYERDGPKPNAWRYRDYVIAAMNEDKPYDRFVLEQLAGDELPDRDTAALIATGYHRMGLWDDEPVDADQAYYDSLDDVVSTTGLVFLATTMGCARCHDHKIDPIPQRDYYRMLAFFHNTYRDIQQLEFKKTAFTLNTQTVIADAPAREQHERRQQQYHEQSERLRQQIEEFEQQIFESFSNPEKEDAQDQEVRRHMIEQRAEQVLTADQLRRYRSARQEMRQLRRLRLPPLDEALTIRENGRSAPDTFVLIRGNAHAPGEIVAPGFPQAITDQPPATAELPEDIDSSGRRLAFAQWLVDPQNPLTARVIVNRVWQHHFGRGLVRTSSDFGRYGEAPTHPELLDYLAAELIRHDWQLKWLHRLILTSQTYRRSSHDQTRGLELDPENHLFWRFDMRRLTAEEVRDTVLSVTGQLNLKMSGPSVFPKLPDEILQSASRPDAAWGRSAAEDQVRRSVYVFVKRSISDPVLLAFDLADKDGSCPVRFSTTVPTQALTSLNGEFFNTQADHFARRLLRECGDDPPRQVTLALRTALAREPAAEEVERGVELLRTWQAEDGVSADEALRYFCLLVLNLNEMMYID